MAAVAVAMEGRAGICPAATGKRRARFLHQGFNLCETPVGALYMTSFNKREEAFERKFVLDEELRFKAMARRNRLLGEWVAGKLGKSGQEASDYARSVILADFEEAGDEDVFRKVSSDLAAGGVTTSETEIRETMERLLAAAVEEVQAGS